MPGDTIGGRMAIEYLIDAGFTRVALINGQQGVDNSRNRLNGYKQALASNDIPFDENLVRWGNWEASSGYELTLELMRLPKPPEAIFCANDTMALGCYDALRDLKLRVPEDVSVVGYDDREIASQLRPKLTTFVLPQYEMGEIAVQYLIDGPMAMKLRQKQIKVECTIVERDSVKRGHNTNATKRV